MNQSTKSKGEKNYDYKAVVIRSYNPLQTEIIEGESKSKNVKWAAIVAARAIATHNDVDALILLYDAKTGKHVHSSRLRKASCASYRERITNQAKYARKSRTREIERLYCYLPRPKIITKASGHRRQTYYEIIIKEIYIAKSGRLATRAVPREALPDALRTDGRLVRESNLQSELDRIMANLYSRSSLPDIEQAQKVASKWPNYEHIIKLIKRYYRIDS